MQNEQTAIEKHRRKILKNRKVISVKTEDGEFEFYAKPDFYEEYLIDKKTPEFLRKMRKKNFANSFDRKLFAKEYSYLTICSKSKIDNLKLKSLSKILLEVVKKKTEGVNINNLLNSKRGGEK